MASLEHLFTIHTTTMSCLVLTKILLLVVATATTTSAKPGHHEIPLEGIPDLSGYDHLSYPRFDLQELGAEVHGEIPPKTIKISNTVTLKVPRPYPVKVPHNVPVPVPFAKPYPVEVTKFIRVPHPVPVEVVKQVPVPVEVPKPYPVSHDEYAAGGGQAGGSAHAAAAAAASSDSFGADFSGGHAGEYEQAAPDHFHGEGQGYGVHVLGIQGDQSGSYSSSSSLDNQHQPQEDLASKDGYESHE